MFKKRIPGPELSQEEKDKRNRIVCITLIVLAVVAVACGLFLGGGGQTDPVFYAGVSRDTMQIDTTSEDTLVEEKEHRHAEETTTDNSENIEQDAVVSEDAVVEPSTPAPAEKPAPTIKIEKPVSVETTTTE